MVAFSEQQIDRAVKMLEHLPGEAPKALARAMNRATENARTEAARRISRRYAIKISAAKRKMGKVKLASPQRLIAQFVTVDRRPGLYLFGPHPAEPGTGGPGKRSLKVRVLRENSPKKIRAAFIAPLRSGNIHVTKRIPDTRMASNPKKEKVRALYGPAVPQMLGQESVLAEVERVAAERLDARLDHEIARVLGRVR
jgi:hypothetical protein